MITLIYPSEIYLAERLGIYQSEEGIQLIAFAPSGNARVLKNGSLEEVQNAYSQIASIIAEHGASKPIRIEE